MSESTSTASSSVIDRIVGRMDRRPVLLDIGASAESPRIWLPFCRQSIYIGFDPDLREMRETNGGDFFKATILNEAVTASPDGNVTFYLTTAPQCSSTLKPNTEVLANYLHPERFNIEREVQATATTLNAVLDRLGLDRIDWLKIDTQGTDLRTYNSLRDSVRSKILAVDTEPGLRGAYVGEDLFGDVHRDLIKEGFWLSNANVKGFPRVRESTMKVLAGRDPAMTQDTIQKSIRRSPGWVECRYLRTIEWMARAGFAKRDYQLLWVFAHSDGQYGFAADLALEYEKLFGADAEEKATGKAMLDESLKRLQGAWASFQAQKASQNSLLARVRRKIGRTLRGMSSSNGTAAK